MTSEQQTASQELETVNPHADLSDDVFILIGLFLVFVLVKSKIRDWILK